MNEEQVREIIRDELGTLIRSDRFTFEKLIQILDGRNLQVGRTTGTQFATAVDQKLAFHGVEPVIQASKINDPSGAGDAGVDTPARTAINSIIDVLEDKGITASS